MTEPLPDVWTTRDYPVLREVARRIDAGEDTVKVEDIATAIGMPGEVVEQAGRALKRRGLLDTMGVAEGRILRLHGLTGEAYFITGLHPNGDDAVTRLVSALRQAADQVDDPAEKSRLRTLADNVGSVSRDVIGGVLTAVLTAGIAS